jgi:phosphatidylinositol alpha-mannosyltransferase
VRRPSIAVICPFSWSVPGGVQTHAAGLARYLRGRGWHVDVLAPADDDVHDEGFIPLGRTVAFRDNGSITRVALGPAAAQRTARLVRERGYDLVHLHEPMTPATCLTAAFAARIPVVGTFHTAAPTRRWYRLFAPVVERAASRLHARIAVSEPARRFVSASLPGGYRIIPNAIDTAAYIERGVVRHGGRLLFVGRPDPRKGLPVLLEALRRLDPVPELDLVGVRPSELARHARRLPRRVARKVYAHGRVSDAGKRRFLAQADVLCAPSLGRESFGLVLLEGMAAGVPVIASRIPAYQRVLPESCGRLVTAGDSPALARAIAELLSDAGLRERMGGAGQREAARYDWDVVGELITQVYGQVLDGDVAHVANGNGNGHGRRRLAPARAGLEQSAAGD